MIQLGAAPAPASAEYIDQVSFRGSVAMEEIVFLHRSSGTAIFDDLIENFEQTFLDANRRRWLARCAHFLGIAAPDGKTPGFPGLFPFPAPWPSPQSPGQFSWAPKRMVMAVKSIRRSFAWLS